MNRRGIRRTFNKLAASLIGGFVVTTGFYILAIIPIALIWFFVVGLVYLVTGSAPTADYSFMESMAYFYVFSVIAAAGVIFITHK
jgi:hypothetical protein